MAKITYLGSVNDNIWKLCYTESYEYKRISSLTTFYLMIRI